MANLSLGSCQVPLTADGLGHGAPPQGLGPTALTLPSLASLLPAEAPTGVGTSLFWLLFLASSPGESSTPGMLCLCLHDRLSTR